MFKNFWYAVEFSTGASPMVEHDGVVAEFDPDLGQDAVGGGLDAG